VNDKIDEAFLTAGKVNLISITEHGHFDTKGFLFVSLLEEFRYYSVRPEVGDIKWTSGVTDISCVNQSFYQVQFILVLEVSFFFVQVFPGFEFRLNGSVL